MSDRINMRSIWEMDRDHFIHPYTDFSTFRRDGSQIITASNGMYVQDASGRSFLDGIAGLWCVNIGHGRQEMADAIAEQALKMAYYNPFGQSTNEPASILAAELAARAPEGLGHVFYACSGSAANDHAVRLAHYYFNRLGKPWKKKVISRIDGYHGATYLAASLTGIHSTKPNFDHVPDFIEHISAANLYRKPAGMSDQAYCDHLVEEFEARILQLDPNRVAAFIAEPIMGAGGVLVAPAGYHRRMWDVCQAHDILYISDEVVTAFGRLGHMFASEEAFGVRPDIINVAKGLTSGYVPLSASLLSDKIYDVISSADPEPAVLTTGFTYSGHPVACAAALKNIEILEREGLCAHVRAVGPLFERAMARLSDLDIVGDVRGSHLMIGIELVSDKAAKTGFAPHVGAAKRVFDECLREGLIVRPIGNLVVLSPPLIAEESHCEQMAEVLGRAVRKVQEDLRAERLI